MIKANCSFRGGKPQITFRPQRLAGVKLSLVADKYRGIVAGTAIGMWVHDQLFAASALFGIVLVWTVVVVARKHWSPLIQRQQVLQKIALGKLVDTVQVENQPDLAEQIAGTVLAQGRWAEAESLLQSMPDSEHKLYWLSILKLAQGQGQAALALAPAKTEPHWLTLRAVAALSIGDGDKVISILRSGRRLTGIDKSTQTEWIYLRASANFQLGRFRTAEKLLKPLVRKEGLGYGRAGEMLSILQDRGQR